MKYYLAGLLTLCTLTACDTVSRVDHAQYWQRASISDAAYQQGPKAQAMLNRDIARCVTELKELERIGTIRNAIPADNHGYVLDRDEEAYNRFDTPERFGGLNLEVSEYQDFESCMMAKGWERIKYVPYHVADKARKTYLHSIGEYEYGSRQGHSPSASRRMND